ncbi:hypothetical protein BOX15_Mlig012070g1 [Macrostomum lignano]|uniref:Uncharacterized protein n=1 Tax=Macrostomum lignano TaxID=282301 RepID=A0A267GN03_9PLAT|nr:hypothetical protein BOX15_Mlig012070g2 [Macrostomum lignano]PAA87401.1 hypothetical protein BOX15_Mlig012070g3 [Macrostomum lignano]PAA90676.1 hypothetical protein BOX15_Mlig012070g1 [Macrostomum lignano]
MAKSSAKGEEVMEQLSVQKQVVIADFIARQETLQPPIFFDMPRTEQVQSADVGHSLRDMISCPEGFFGIDHPNTSWLINLLKDTSEWRLQKALLSLRTRPLFESNKYYQVIDRPSYYWGEAASMDKPVFNNKAMLYLNSFGVALYLKAETGCLKLASAKSGKNYLVNVTAPQFASFVHDSEYDLVRFQFDFLCIKREYYQGLHYLALAGWNPSNTTLLTYRRKYYQFGVPFTDWIDVLRYVLERRPSINVAGLVEKMFNLQYVVSQAYNFNMGLLKEVGKVMMESFELKELTRHNFNNPTKLGNYAGRKVLKNKDVPVPDEYATVFSDKDGKPKNPVRPVVPNIMSYVRRLLTYQYYFDGKHLFALPQILRAVLCFKQHDFFVISQTVKSSAETDSTGMHRLYIDPIIFQLNYFLNLKSDGMYLRHKQWSSHATSAESDGITEEERAWVYRFDTINCLSLLTGLLQNCLIKNMSSVIIEALCDLIVFIMVDSELIEPFFRYSYYDTYFGLTSVINCVPNLMSKTVMRLLKKAPITLVSNFEISQITRMFTMSFWKLTPNQMDAIVVPKNLDDITEFIITKKRRVSMKMEGPATGEAMSGASAVGAAGGITMFIRNYDDMTEISAADENAEQPASETTKKQDEERKHVYEYKHMEIDARYSTVFPLYFEGLNKVQINYDENKMFDDCVFESYSQHMLAHLKK